MTKNEAIQAMKEGQKVTHRNFSQNEWITMTADEEGENLIEHEDGALLDEDIFWEMRQNEVWNNDWSIWQEV